MGLGGPDARGQRLRRDLSVCLQKQGIQVPRAEPPCLGSVKTRTNLNNESLVGPGFVDTKIRQASSFSISVICRSHTFSHKPFQRESNKGFASNVLFLLSV